MSTIEVQVRRFSVVSSRPFEEIVRSLTATIGHPDMNAFHSAVAAARTVADEHYRNHGEPAAQTALARRAGAELVRSAGRARAADSASRRLLPDFHFGFGQGIESDQTTVRRGQDFTSRSGRRCAGG